MIEIGSAICYARTVEESALQQIAEIERSAIGGESAHIRIMPDAHSGKGCVIGTTMLVADKVIPSVVGVDIGCGVVAYHISSDISITELDAFCSAHIVSGQSILPHPLAYDGTDLLHQLYCYDFLRSEEYLSRSLGTLGGGNHFIELDVAQDGSYWLIIHSGSRHLGIEVALYYQQIADSLDGYLYGEDMEHYLHDIDLCQQWAVASRSAIAEQILDGLGLQYDDMIESIHNYVDVEHMILRKGAISAQYGEMCLIPLNMRDGTLICRGRGCAEWNYSAPHGAGRLMSRDQARQSIALEDFEESMQGIVSSTVCQATIDESPFAYKDYAEIMEIVQDTVEIVERIVPVFNYKATT